MLWPSGSRPYLAGSTNNSFMNLVLGYNGFGRVIGQNHHGGDQKQMQACFEAIGELIRRHGGHGFGGRQQGLARLFTGEWGLEVSFLLPAATVALVALIVLRRRAPRTDPVRAGALLFGLWMLIDGALLAEMKQATAARWTEFEASVSAATARLRKSTEKAAG